MNKATVCFILAGLFQGDERQVAGALDTTLGGLHGRRQVYNSNLEVVRLAAGKTEAFHFCSMSNKLRALRLLALEPSARTRVVSLAQGRTLACNTD